jgi:hypothetical protein
MVSKEGEPEEPVTRLVRQMLVQHKRAGGMIKDIVRRGQFRAQSMVSQVHGGTSLVTNFTGPKFAKAFGLSYVELVTRAYSGESKDPLRAREDGTAAAITWGASAVDVRRVYSRCQGPRFDKMSAEWWRDEILREADGRREAEVALEAPVAAEKAAERTARRRAKRASEEAQAAEKRREQEHHPAKRRRHKGAA